MFKTAGLTIAFLFSLTHLSAQELTDSSTIADDEIREITQQFERDTQNLASYYQQQAEAIDTPDSDNSVEAAVKVDIDVTWDITSFKMDIPKFKMTDKRMSLDLPQVTMKNKEVKFDVPEVRMVTKKVGQKPEVTVKWVNEKVGLGIKTKVPKTYVKWTDIMMDIPETHTSTKKIVAGVPEFKMDTASFIIGIPEVWMETQEMKLHLPQFKVTNIDAELKKVENEATNLQSEAENAINQRSQKFNSELGSAIVKKISEPFDEQKNKLSEQITSFEKQSLSARELYNESINSLKSNGMQDTDSQLLNLVKQRDEVQSSFSNAIVKLSKSIEELTVQQKTAIDDALSKLQS